jgi:hypothetical protein
MENLCPICGQPLKLIPAGISKGTGKAYQAFWSCPNRCKQTSQPKPTPIQNFSANLDQQNNDKKWQEISTGKVRHGFAIEAFKKGLPLNVKTAVEINAWTSYVMSGKLSPIADPDPEMTDYSPY